MSELLEFADAQAMNRALADAIVERLAAGVTRNGQASLVVSGGTTPADLFDVLAACDAPWKDVWVTLSDERWVDPASDRSNEHLVRTHLLKGKAATARFVPLKTASAHANEAEAETGAAVAAMPRPFDVLLLGLGNDGHTASLIPGAEGLAGALDQSDPALTRSVHPPASTGMGERLTLTLRALLESRWIALLIRGAEKLETYNKVSGGGDVLMAPVRGVLRQSRVPVTAYWSP